MGSKSRDLAGARARMSAETELRWGWCVVYGVDEVRDDRDSGFVGEL